MKDIVTVASRTDSSMEKLTRSIETISTVSDQILRLIRAIEEVAFQTDQKPLNCVNEVASGVDACAGLAVAVEQARDLAFCASAMVKETAALIEKTRQRVEEVSQQE